MCASFTNPQSIKLVYWDLPAKAEPIRLTLHVGGVDFVDERLTGAQWNALKATISPYAQLPLMEINGVRVFQSINLLLYASKISGLHPTDALDELRVIEAVCACDDILNSLNSTFSITDLEERCAARAIMMKDGGKTHACLKRIEELIGDKTYIAGNKLSVADLDIFTHCAMLRCGFFDGFPKDCIDLHPKLRAFVNRIAAEPKVAEYYDKQSAPWAAGFRPEVE